MNRWWGGIPMAALCMGGLAWSSGQAQPPPRDQEERAPSRPVPPRGPRPVPFEQALFSLGLSEDQEAKVDEILYNHRKKVREQLRKLQDDLMSQLKGVLNADQFRRFEQTLQSMGPPPGERRGDKGPPDREDRRGRSPPPEGSEPPPR